VDFNIGKALSNVSDQKKRKALLFISLSVNLGMLFVFKYYNLFASAGTSLMSVLGVGWHPPLIEVVLPVGISFYTFQTLSYTIDLYYKKIEPEKCIWTFAAFVSFFPQLVAGPILRAKEFIPQLKRNRDFTWEIFYQGFFLIVFGLFKKVVIADNLAPYVERVYDNNFAVSFMDAWFSTLAFTFQIYMDFSGYSDIAIGLSLLLGFYIRDNFNSPYAAISFSDFWRRWHISLSSWLRDYLYIPLGGNRKGTSRTNVNLIVTMLLGGLWHGAAWNYVLWGALHGIYLTIERLLRVNRSAEKRLLFLTFYRIFIFVMIVFTWVIFRADFFRAKEIYLAMFGFESVGAIHLLSPSNVLAISAITIIILSFQYYFAKRKIIEVFSSLKYSTILYVVGMVILIISVITLKGDGGAFIYFQF
jgi:alginate O-acetyltransferase complex protein AlgI